MAVLSEDPAERVGDPRTIHPEGRPYSVGSYNRGCRCVTCKGLKANDYQKRRGRPPRVNVPGTELKRPPGVVWLDWSGITGVVRCERCQKNYGTWLDQHTASKFREAHADLHAAEPPFDWSAYDAERIMKNPGGRPPRVDVPLCREEDCLEDSRKLGLCETHYKAFKRAVARTEAEQQVAQAEYEERRKNPPKRVRKPSKTASLCKAPMCGSRPVQGKYCEAHS